MQCNCFSGSRDKNARVTFTRMKRWRRSKARLGGHLIQTFSGGIQVCGLGLVGLLLVLLKKTWLKIEELYSIIRTFQYIPIIFWTYTFKSHPSWHTMLFQRSCNVVWTLWTLDGRYFDSLCRLGWYVIQGQHKAMFPILSMSTIKAHFTHVTSPSQSPPVKIRYILIDSSQVI